MSLHLSSMLYVLQTITIIALTFISGLSFCLSTWVIPNMLLPGTPAKVMIQQFSATIARGERYLQPSSRMLAASLLSILYLTFSSSDVEVARNWTYWATSLAVLMPVAPYEIIAIFPINDRIVSMEVEVKTGTSKEQDKRLREQLVLWQRRNYGRAMLPLLSALIGLQSIAGT